MVEHSTRRLSHKEQEFREHVWDHSSDPFQLLFDERALLSKLVCVKSTVHTSNIGQYGESKDALEMTEAKNMIQQRFHRKTAPILLAFVDGVGFETNRDGLRRLA